MAALGCVTKAKTAFAEEVGRISAMTERELMTGAPNYFLQRIPETQFDTSLGANPRTIRVATVPPMRTEYQPILAAPGNKAMTITDPQDPSRVISTFGDKTGNGCYIPGETIQWGYEEFGRCLRATALETDPICVLDVIEKKAVGATIAKLREALPMYAKEHFGNDLRRQVIKYSQKKYSVADGFPTSFGVPYFPCIPTGGLSIGHLRKIENMIRPEGWNKGAKTPVINGRPALQVLASRDSIQFAITSYKREQGIQIHQNSVTAPDETFGTTEIHDGIQFIEDELPTRGYVVAVAPGLYEFREIQPWKVRAGVEGVVKDVNPDYYLAYINVGGAFYDVCELFFIVHPKAMERQAMGSIPKVDGKSFNKMFNFEVNMVDDAMILADPRCNKDKLYIQMRLTHAYAPLPYNPELMSVGICLAATPQYIVQRPNRPELPAKSEPLQMQGFLPPREAGCGVCDGDPTADASRIQIPGTCDDPFPANGVGVIKHSQITYFVDESAGGLTIVVERQGGNVGAASVVATPTAGTATSPTNFTAGAPVTLNWADGKAGRKSFVIPINVHAGDDQGKQFTVVLSSATGATLTANPTATVTILDADEHVEAE